MLLEVSELSRSPKEPGLSKCAFALAVLASGLAVAVAQPKPGGGLNPASLLGKPAASYDKFFGKPKIQSSQEKALIPGRSYSTEEMAAIPLGTRTDRYYIYKAVNVHVYHGAADKAPSSMRFGFWSKGLKVRTWSDALKAVGIPTVGVTVKASSYDPSNKTLQAKGWTGDWMPDGDEQGYQLVLEKRK